MKILAHRGLYSGALVPGRLGTGAGAEDCWRQQTIHTAKYTREKLWPQMTVFDILAERVAAHPDRIAIKDQNGTTTYVALKDRIERAAQFYRSIGIKRGDVVTIQLPNRVEFAVAFIALELLGAIANKVNPDFRARELDYMLKFSGSSAYVFPREWKEFDYAGMAHGLQQANPALKRLIVVGGAVEGMHDFDGGVTAAAPIIAADKVHMDPNEVCRMCFTSGTTGDPKCALHSFNTTLYAVDLLNRDMEVTEREVFLVFLPLGLNWGYITLLQSILAGATLVLMERFNPRAALELIHEVTVLENDFPHSGDGTTVNLTIWRQGEEKNLSLTLGELPKSKAAHATNSDSDATGAGLPKLGMTVAPAGEVAGSGSEGVVVTEVDPDGVASEHGLKSGDLILEVGGSKVATPEDMRKALGDAQKNGKHAVLMRVKSDGTTKFVAIPFARA